MWARPGGDIGIGVVPSPPRVEVRRVGREVLISRAVPSEIGAVGAVKIGINCDLRAVVIRRSGPPLRTETLLFQVLHVDPTTGDTRRQIIDLMSDRRSSRRADVDRVDARMSS